ncbi:MAG: PAS domain-containing protein, partial [Syntrophales bacterium LBB04]|nr:PAS domain-containing protein [Syntrophales bacterium LBB04]
DEPVTAEYTAVRKDGSRFPVIITAAPIIEGGKPVGLRGVVTDVTDRKHAELRLRDSGEAMKSLLNATNDTAFLMDTEGTIIAANSVLGQLVGREVDDLIGQNIFNFLPKDIAHTRSLSKNHRSLIG